MGELSWLVIPGESPCGGEHGEVTPAAANTKQREPLGREARLQLPQPDTSGMLLPSRLRLP